MSAMVRKAAGIVTFRKGKNGLLEFLLLRNSRHKTWGFPKGHIDGDETPLDCALREFHEETGLAAPMLVPEFQHTTRHQVTENGQNWEKQVTYFLGEALSTALTVSEEHDEAVWLDQPAASKTLQYDSLRELLALAVAAIPS